MRAELPVQPFGVSALAFSPDGLFVALVASRLGAQPSEVLLVSAATGKGPKVLYRSPVSVSGLAFSPNGKLLAFAEGADALVRDRESGKWARLKGHANAVSGVAFSPDRKRLASASSADNSVRVWHLATGRELTSLQHPGPGGGLSFAPVGQALAAGP